MIPAPLDTSGTDGPEVSGNLVTPLAKLIGRDREIETVRAYLCARERRLLTLVGPGGIGKTSLALEVATSVLSLFQDGVWMIDLSAVNEPPQVASAIVDALHLQGVGSLLNVERLREALRDRQMLLVLDNFEQVIDSAPLITELLHVAPELQVLVTSRAPLGLRGEQVIEVPPLAVPPRERPTLEIVGDEVAYIASFEAVQCFVNHAQAVRSEFALTSSNARTVAEICARLDGLPLALELAAARVPLLPPQVMLERLKFPGSLRLKLLVGGARDLPPRQRTMRATIEWSFSLLEPVEQRLFARLAVFSGGFCMEAVAAVCGDEQFEVVDALQSLLTKSLLRQIETPTLALGSGEAWLTMLETIREFAEEQLLASGEAQWIRERHVAYYVTLTERAEQELLRVAQSHWLDRIGHEHENIRAALQWSLSQTEASSVEAALRLASAMTAFWKIRGYPDEARDWWDRLLVAVRTMPDSQQARALSAAGTMAWTNSDFTRATELHAAALELCRQLGDKHGVASALNNLGAQAMEQGRPDEARVLLEESLTLRRDIDDIPGLAETLNNLGVIAEHQGDYAGAAPFYERSLALSQATGDQWMIALGLTNLGEVAQHQGDYTRAVDFYEQGFAVARSLDARRICATLLHRLGNLETVLERPWRAFARLQQGLALWRQLGSTVGVISCLEGIAAVLASGPCHTLERARSSVWLWSVAETQRAAINAHRPLAETLFYAPYIHAARTYLGESNYVTVVDAARAISLEQAIALAQQSHGLQPPQEQEGGGAEHEATRHPGSTQPDARAHIDHLSARELDILRLVATGLSDKEVAARLIISPRTVHAHLASIYSKLGVKSRHAATLYALQHRLVDATVPE
jgi:predicted ATPase/DNA-binding CsgD family transcriptional regulator